MIRKLRKRELIELLRGATYKPRPDLLDVPGGAISVIELENGQVLIYDHVSLSFGTLYPSEEAFRNVNQQPGPVGVKADLQEFPTFFKRIDEAVALDCVQQLLHLTRFKPELLDYSTDSLKRIDSFLKRKKIGHEEIRTQWIPYLIYYAGESLRRSVGGWWKIDFSADGGIYVPSIKTVAGPQIRIVNELYEDLYEHRYLSCWRAIRIFLPLSKSNAPESF
jgi:hypothetical protein